MYSILRVVIVEDEQWFYLPINETPTVIFDISKSKQSKKITPVSNCFRIEPSGKAMEQIYKNIYDIMIKHQFTHVLITSSLVPVNNDILMALLDAAWNNEVVGLSYLDEKNILISDYVIPAGIKKKTVRKQPILSFMEFKGKMSSDINVGLDFICIHEGVFNLINFENNTSKSYEKYIFDEFNNRHIPVLRLGTFISKKANNKIEYDTIKKFIDKETNNISESDLFKLELDAINEKLSKFKKKTIKYYTVLYRQIILSEIVKQETPEPDLSKVYSDLREITDIKYQLLKQKHDKTIFQKFEYITLKSQLENKQANINYILKLRLKHISNLEQEVKNCKDISKLNDKKLELFRAKQAWQITAKKELTDEETTEMLIELKKIKKTSKPNLTDLQNKSRIELELLYNQSYQFAEYKQILAVLKKQKSFPIYKAFLKKVVKLIDELIHKTEEWKPETAIDVYKKHKRLHELNQEITAKRNYLFAIST